MFENGKPDIVLKTLKCFNLKRTPSIILIPENSFKLGIVVLVLPNKMFVIDLTIDFYSRYGLGYLTQSFNLCPFLTLSVRNEPSVSFETNVP